VPAGSRAQPEVAPVAPATVRRTGCARLTVAAADTAESLLSGDVPVLGTPRLVALCEEACCKLLEDRLEPTETTVASRVQFDHLAPVAVGASVVAEAALERVEGRRFVFTVSATSRSDHGGGLVGAGRVTRVLVDRATFLRKAGPTE
jgi:fluoroacetyl-CoA thioesterase